MTKANYLRQVSCGLHGDTPSGFCEKCDAELKKIGKPMQSVWQKNMNVPDPPVVIPSNMKKPQQWEYCSIFSYDCGENGGGLDDLLNNLGRDGWELVVFHLVKGGEWFYFKRPCQK